ncbi:hypothetical protein PACTADRAFT_33955 [Pachysolen tannophilus NRRL Y-2460]|uniref:ER membrane protein complex subunit 2 n=1 Tax=Pachysolen tannophilus NRRL Y-2460 TaxID=669874 RepID=A0A1E4TUI3_PACTA|nr:hypothetical protein PACTADRAFT_33955 [Pachysolen tannophilus NRRL Y-2460]
MSSAIKSRLLDLQKYGKFATLDPKDLFDVYKVTHKFIELNPSPNSSINEFEYYQIIELNFNLCIQTNHDIEAKAMLDILEDKFNIEASERLIVLKSVYIEATFNPQDALNFLNKSVNFFKNKTKDVDDLLLIKRRKFILESRLATKKERAAIYISKLLEYLEIKPLDAMTWSELANEYTKLNLYDKAVYCYQEVLLIEPFAYNIFSKIGELYLLSMLQLYASVSHSGSLSAHNSENLLVLKSLSLKHFLRSVELCETFVRGWAGILKLTSKKFDVNLKIIKKSSSTDVKQNDDLHALATKRLQKIVENDLSSSENIKIAEIVLKSYTHSD